MKYFSALFIFFIIVFLLSGCSHPLHPQKGDYYDNRVTGKRVMVYSVESTPAFELRRDDGKADKNHMMVEHIFRDDTLIVNNNICVTFFNADLSMQASMYFNAVILVCEVYTVPHFEHDYELAIPAH